MSKLAKLILLFESIESIVLSIIFLITGAFRFSLERGGSILANGFVKSLSMLFVNVGLRNGFVSFLGSDSSMNGFDKSVSSLFSRNGFSFFSS